MDVFTACSIIEGFSGEESTPQQILEAWAFLIKSGMAFKLQGSYGRGATSMIENGYITKDGEITQAALDVCGDD